MLWLQPNMSVGYVAMDLAKPGQKKEYQNVTGDGHAFSPGNI